MVEAVLASIVTLTMGIVLAVRLAKIVPDRVLPLISIVIGCVFAYLTGDRGGDILIYGTMIGLMASGMWSGGKTLLTSKATPEAESEG